MRVFIAPVSEPTNGTWHDLSDFTDCEGLEAAARAAMRLTPENNYGEELDCSDYKGFGDIFKGFAYISPMDAWVVYEWAQSLPSHIPLAAALAYVMELGNPPHDLPRISDLEEYYCGEWDSFLEYAENFLNECGTLSSIPEEFRRYFDTEAYARDMKLDYWTHEEGSKVYIFRNC